MLHESSLPGSEPVSRPSNPTTISNQVSQLLLLLLLLRLNVVNAEFRRFRIASSSNATAGDQRWVWRGADNCADWVFTAKYIYLSGAHPRPMSVSFRWDTAAKDVLHSRFNKMFAVELRCNAAAAAHRKLTFANYILLKISKHHWPDYYNVSKYFQVNSVDWLYLHQAQMVSAVWICYCHSLNKCTARVTSINLTRCSDVTKFSINGHQLHSAMYVYYVKQNRRSI